MRSEPQGPPEPGATTWGHDHPLKAQEICVRPISRLKNSHASPRHPTSANPAPGHGHCADGDETQVCHLSAVRSRKQTHAPLTVGHGAVDRPIVRFKLNVT